MREKKFRAKHVNALSVNSKLDGKWIYGFLCDDSYIYSPELGGEFFIDKNTLGEYTGLKDNGKEIYEGDIIAIVNSKGEVLRKAVVEWDDIRAAFKAEGIPGMDVGLFNARFCEVIGNIYDNPELYEK